MVQILTGFLKKKSTLTLVTKVHLRNDLVEAPASVNLVSLAWEPELPGLHHKA